MKQTIDIGRTGQKMLITRKAVKGRLKTARSTFALLPRLFGTLVWLRPEVWPSGSFTEKRVSNGPETKKREIKVVPGPDDLLFRWTSTLARVVEEIIAAFFSRQGYFYYDSRVTSREIPGLENEKLALSPIRISLNQNFRLSPSREINSLGEKRKWEKWRMKTWLEGKNINLVHF